MTHIPGADVNSPADDIINIALASDARGVEGILIAASSAIVRASRPVYVWMIEDGVSAQAQAQLTSAWRALPNCAGVTFISIDALPIAFPSWWNFGRWPRSSCSRFQLSEVLPTWAHRCIYLDYDTLTLTDLAPLFDIDMRGLPIGMVPNDANLDDSKQYIEAMGIVYAEYCNAGVLLLDLDMWKQERLAHGLIEYGVGLGPALRFFDQDMLNGFFAKRCLLLDRTWNMIDASVDDGAIVHFAGSAKPWDVDDSDSLPAHRAWLRERADIPVKTFAPSVIADIAVRWAALRSKGQRWLLRKLRPATSKQSG